MKVILQYHCGHRPPTPGTWLSDVTLRNFIGRSTFACNIIHPDLWICYTVFHFILSMFVHDSLIYWSSLIIAPFPLFDMDEVNVKNADLLACLWVGEWDVEVGSGLGSGKGKGRERCGKKEAELVCVWFSYSSQWELVVSCRQTGH